MADNRNPAISLCRVCSMVMIVLCHIIGKYTIMPGHGFLGDILDVGVYSFFAMSGYLYGAKTVTDFKQWMARRLRTVALPASVLTVIVLTITQVSTKGGYSILSTVTYLLNLQGLGFLHTGFYRFFRELQILGPLCFITVILLCYCMVPVLQQLRERVPGYRHGCLTAIGATAICYALCVLTGISLVYFLTFSIGYFLAASGRPASRWDAAVLTALMLGSQALRLLLRISCDGTPVYQTYALYSHMMLGIWILCFFLTANRLFPRLMDTLAGSRIVTAANGLSMYVYLTHCCFCRGSLNIYNLTPSLLVATIGFTAATLTASFGLKYLTERTRQMLEKGIRRE